MEKNKPHRALLNKVKTPLLLRLYFAGLRQ